MVTTRRGTPSRLAIAVAAIGSVGATTAPSTKAGAQPSPTARWATTATAAIVVATSPVASSEIGCAFTRKSRNEVKKPAE